MVERANYVSKPNRYRQLQIDDVAKLATGPNYARGQLQTGTLANGKKFLRAVFPTPTASSKEQTINLDYLLAAPNLWEPLAEGFVARARKLEPITRAATAISLKVGFIEFLTDRKLLKISLRSITTEFLNEFLAWTNRAVAGKAVWAIGTRAKKYRALTGILRTLRVLQPWSTELPAGFRIPSLKDPVKDYTPTEVISQDSWEAVVLACTKEIENCIQNFEQGQALMEQGRSRLKDMKIDLSNPLLKHGMLTALRNDTAFVVAALNEICPDGPIPGAEALERKSPFVGSLVNGFGTEFVKGRVRTIISYFHPTVPRQIIPFAILFAMYFAYNPTAIKRLKIDDFEYCEVLGVRRIRVKAHKKRAGRRQPRSFPVSDSYENPAVLFEFMKLWTERLRSSCPAWSSDYLFIVSTPSNGKPVISTLGSWTNKAIAEFCTDHGIKPFVLRQIRPTALDIIEELFNGDIRAVQAASGHRNPDTFYSHYTSSGARARNWERLGISMSLRTRWIDTDGLIDPRAESENGGDVGCATPGWGCLDPLDSPQPGQVKGKLCTAYGACPGCALGQIDSKSVYAHARVLQLRDLIIRSQTLMQAERWLQAWAPILHKINEYWLKVFGENRLAEALKSQLPELPPLE